MDTWIHGYQFSLDTWIFGYFGYPIQVSGYFWILFSSYCTWEKGNQIQGLRLCSMIFYLTSSEQLCNCHLASV